MVKHDSASILTLAAMRLAAFYPITSFYVKRNMQHEKLHDLHGRCLTIEVTPNSWTIQLLGVFLCPNITEHLN